MLDMESNHRAPLSLKLGASANSMLSLSPGTWGPAGFCIPRVKWSRAGPSYEMQGEWVGAWRQPIPPPRLWRLLGVGNPIYKARL